MIISTVIAVALGVTPVKDDSVHIVSGDYSGRIGRYTQTVDQKGNTHLKGFSPSTHSTYDLVVHKNGNVEGSVGAWAVTFHVRDAG